MWCVILLIYANGICLSPQVTRMEVSNLTLVFAPNCIKNPTDDMTAIAMNAESEKRCLQLFVDALGGQGESWPPP